MTQLIYDDYVTFFTFRRGKIVAFTIQDPEIAQLHRMTFETMWASID